jgi:hypothetical protein
MLGMSCTIDAFTVSIIGPVKAVGERDGEQPRKDSPRVAKKT